MVQARGEAEAARGAQPHEPGRDPPPEREIQAGGGRVQRGVEAAAGRRDHHHEPAQIGGDPRVTSHRNGTRRDDDEPTRRRTPPPQPPQSPLPTITDSPYPPTHPRHPDLPPDIRLYPSTGAPTSPRGTASRHPPGGPRRAPDSYRLLWYVKNKSFLYFSLTESVLCFTSPLRFPFSSPLCSERRKSERDAARIFSPAPLWWLRSHSINIESICTKTTTPTLEYLSLHFKSHPRAAELGRRGKAKVKKTDEGNSEDRGRHSRCRES